jgi:hypothetical protein
MDCPPAAHEVPLGPSDSIRIFPHRIDLFPDPCAEEIQNRPGLVSLVLHREPAALPDANS